MALLSLDALTGIIRHYFISTDKRLPEAFNVDTDLFSSGLLDSLNTVEFVLYLEETLNKEIPIGDFSISAIKNISSVYDSYILEQAEG
jgi:D-alanine--poly(phosphoribitol) ligase subunit 2